MAKSARASVRKTNRTKLRASVFSPVYEARTQRLSQKLMDLASQPKANRDMEVEQPADSENAVDPDAEETGHADDTVMDVDGTAKAGSSVTESRNAQKKRKAEKSARVEKHRHRKGTNRIAFAKKTKKPKK